MLYPPTRQMTLDNIITSFNAGTLANESDAALHDAQIKIAMWHDWRCHNPQAKPDAVPKVDVLLSIYQFIEKTTNRRYGCND
jgi:hypothetical protein